MNTTALLDAEETKMQQFLEWFLAEERIPLDVRSEILFALEHGSDMELVERKIEAALDELQRVNDAEIEILNAQHAALHHAQEREKDPAQSLRVNIAQAYGVSIEQVVQEALAQINEDLQKEDRAEEASAEATLEASTQKIKDELLS